MTHPSIIPILAASLAMSALSAVAQSAEPAAGQTAHLTEKGEVTIAGRTVAYLIRRLPVSSFPELPAVVADSLTQRGCSIPQTYQAHRPENVVHASFEQPGSSDWAVLCASEGAVSLLVFFESDLEHPEVLTTSPEKQRLQVHDLTGVMGFNWGIDPASPRQVREAQAAMAHRPTVPDHDALADTILEKGTIYHFYAKKAWTTLEMTE
jgi:hypothetical protein